MEPITNNNTGSSQGVINQNRVEQLVPNGPEAKDDRPTGLSQEAQNTLLIEFKLRQQLKNNPANPAQGPTAVSLCGDAGYSAAYSFVQSPAVGLAQLVSTDMAKNIHIMPPPEPAPFGTARWHAQVVGDAAGIVLPFMATHYALKSSGLSFVAREERAIAVGRLACRSSAAGIADSAITGFTFDFMARPVDPTKGIFLVERTKNGITGALTFGTLSAAGKGLSNTSRSLSAELSGAQKVAFNAGKGALSGVPAGLVNAEASSLLKEGRLATNRERVEGVYGMMVAGGALGAFHRDPRKLTAQKPGEDNRPGRSNLDAVVNDRVQTESLNRAIEANSTAKPGTTAGVVAPEADMLAKRTESGSEADRLVKDRAEVIKLPGAIVPKETISMRELVQNDDPRVDQLLKDYYPKLERAFPLEGEIETTDTYKEYLSKPDGTWDMVLLRDAEQNIIGGIQFQVIDAKGETLSKVAWVEHIWVEEENRTFPNFKSLLKIAEERTKAAGGELVFMEFNNPDKMTPEQMAEDAEGGITTQDRETLWGSVGIHLAADSKGNIAPYGQPSMDGQPAVEYLSLGFIGSESLTGKQLPVRDYLALARAAHATIPGVDLATDPTVTGYSKECNKIIDSNYTLQPLAAQSKARRAAKSK